MGSDPPPNLPRKQLAEGFLQRFPDLRNRKLVLFLSRLHPKKGLDLLIPAFRAVVSTHRDAHLVLVGPGDGDYIASIRCLVHREGLADHTTITGPLFDQAKWEALAAASMLVLPSYQENFALVVAEAMRLGLPIVLSRRVNIWSDVVEAGAGAVCDLTADSVAHVIIHYLDNPIVAEQAGRQGQRLATESFNWDRTAAAVDEVYRNVLSSKNRIGGRAWA